MPEIELRMDDSFLAFGQDEGSTILDAGVVPFGMLAGNALRLHRFCGGSLLPIRPERALHSDDLNRIEPYHPAPPSFSHR